MDVPNTAGAVPHYLSIKVGEDVLEAVLSYFNTIPPGRTGMILSAIGRISNPIICTGMTTKSYEGSFDVVTLNGKFIVPKVGEAELSGDLNMTFSGQDNVLFFGEVKGPLIAATCVEVTVYSFFDGTMT